MGEELAQGPYEAATVGFEHATIRNKGDESTNEPPLSTTICYSGIKIKRQFQHVFDVQVLIEY